jgi:hypothetical protein
MKYMLLTPVFFFLLQISASPALAADSSDSSGDCDKAIHVFWKGRIEPDKHQVRRFYQEAIELCSGYIRPYELIGNSYRKENQKDKAITYFTKAAELGTTNYKLYYLLASLLFEKGDLDEADRNIKKSLRIRPDYPKAVKLNREIEKVIDKEGPKIILYEPSTRRGMKVVGEKYALPPLTRIDSTSQTKALYGKSFAVVIGINHYEKWPGLEFAVADANAVKDTLQKSGFDDITLIMDQDATQRRILTELFHKLPQKVNRNDRVLFYFAGHGQTENLPGGGKKGYIIPVDAETDSYASSALSMEQIRNLSSRIAAKHIFYVMDCCYSGLGLNRSAGVWPGISDYLRKVSAMRVVQIITAGGQGEQVQEREGHGLFTSYFLKAIEGEADLDKDNVVTGTELGAYLRPTVSNASRQAQTPLFGRLEGEGEFLFFVKKEK